MGYGHSGSYTDSNGVIWEGMPLWYLAGMVDDTTQHGSGAFNDALAASGYSIVVTGRTGTSVTLDSKTVARSSSYLIANKKNGVAIPATDPAAPLVLVGSGTGIGNGVTGVTDIRLSFGSGTPSPTPTPVPTPAPTQSPAPTTAPSPVNAATTLSLEGAVSRNITQSYLASGVAYGHAGTFTDSNGAKWAGMPLWYLAGMVDDTTQHGPGAFNDALAAAGGYTIIVTGRDGTSVSLNSKKVARSSAYLVANTKNGAALPYTDPSAPFSLVGSGAGIGSGIKDISSIRLAAVPGAPITIAPIPTQPVTPTVSPTVATSSSSFSLSGAASRTIDMTYFKNGVAYGHAGSYRDSNGVTWEGMPLWYLAGMVDDSTQHGSGAFNDALAAQGYTITVTGRDGTSVNLDSKAVSRSNAYIVANKKNGVALAATDPNAPVRLVGDGAGVGNGVAGITGISLIFGATPTPTITPTVTTTTTAVNGNIWNISVEGMMNKIVTKSWFEGGVTAGHIGTYKDPEGKTWQGIPLWYFTGLSDDNKQHGTGAFNDAAAQAGYTITVTGRDDASITLDSRNVTRSSSYLVANRVNGAPIPVSEKNAPVALVGPDIPSGKVIGGVERIVITFPESKNSASLPAENSAPGSTGTGAATRPAEKTVAVSTTIGGPSPIPTFTFRIKFTPFPELLIQYGQPGVDETTDTTGTTSATGVSGSRDTSSVPDNNLALKGAISDSVTVQKVQDGIAYGHRAEYTDPEGNTYEGMPLWFFAGWVDDENVHNAGAFNDDIARNGYDITVTGKSGETVIGSTDAMRSDGFLIATTKNGEHLTTDTGGPLMLVGNSVPVDYQVTGVSAIALNLPKSG